MFCAIDRFKKLKVKTRKWIQYIYSNHRKPSQEKRKEVQIFTIRNLKWCVCVCVYIHIYVLYVYIYTYIYIYIYIYFTSAADHRKISQDHNEKLSANKFEILDKVGIELSNTYSIGNCTLST